MKGNAVKRATHLLFGLGTTLFLFNPINSENVYVLSFVGAIGSLAPDLDVKFKHRAALHNVFAMFAASILFMMIFLYLGYDLKQSTIISSAGAYAYSSHLLLDSLTYRGVRLFWPLKGKWYGAKKARYDSTALNAALSTIGVVLILIAVLR